MLTSSNIIVRIHCFILIIVAITSSHLAVADKQGPVNITPDKPFIEIKHKGKIIRIQRIQDNDNLVEPDFAQTSRPCPPYCIQPMLLAQGVETIGELEVLQYLQDINKGKPVILIDSREPEWLNKGMIPGAISIPWTKLHNETASDENIADILQLRFNAVQLGELWNFEVVKTLVFYCNGPWCGQSPTNIRALLSIGYPPHKIKWYRGGIQNWKQLGLTTVTP